MSKHQHFEILCALASAGQASDVDLQDLKAHLQTCLDCQIRMADFAQISCQALSLSGPRRSSLRSSKVLTARFVERARAEGIPLRARGTITPRDLWLNSTWRGRLATALLLLTVMGGGITKSLRLRVDTVDVVTVAQLEPSIQTNTSSHSVLRTTDGTVRPPARVANIRLQKTVRAPERTDFRQENDVDWKGIRANNSRSLRIDDQLFLTALSGQRATYGLRSVREQFVAPWTATLSKYEIKRSTAYFGGRTEYHEDAPAMMASLQVFPWKSDHLLLDSRVLLDSRPHPEWPKKINWSRMQFSKLNLTAFPDSKSLYQVYPGRFDKRWPFAMN